MAVNDEVIRPLTKRQRKALESLAVSGRVGAAAAAAGVHRKTVYEWMKQPAFSAAIDALEDTSIRFLSGRLTAISEDAVQAIENGLKHEDVRINLQAAGLYFGQLLRLREMVTQDQRLADMERRIDELATFDED